MTQAMSSDPLKKLSRREREVVEILYFLGEGLATDIQAKLGPDMKNAATRKILTSLLDKGVITRRKDGRRYVYTPIEAAETVGNSAMAQVLATFFKGSFSSGLLGMIELGKDRFTDEEIEQIRKIVKDKN
jgi:BlaI family penicillinase repressor